MLDLNGMLELNLTGGTSRFPALRAAAEHAERTRYTQGHRAANQALLEAVGLRMLITRNDDYYRQALDYHLGLLYAYLGEPDRAAEYFEKSGTLAHGGGFLPFSDAVTQALALHEMQTQAALRGMPPIFIACMPRSASASLTQTISTTLDIPAVRVSTGDFPYYYIVPRWLRCLPGGAVTHDHFGASEFNLKILSASAVRDVFVLVRDPRAAAASRVNMKLRAGLVPHDKELLKAEFMETALHKFIRWLSDWTEAASAPNSHLRIHWILSPCSGADLRSSVRDILSILAAECPALRPYVDQEIKEITANFVAGDDDAWRTLADDADRKVLWNAIPERARNLLGLTP